MMRGNVVNCLTLRGGSSSGALPQPHAAGQGQPPLLAGALCGERPPRQRGGRAAPGHVFAGSGCRGAERAPAGRKKHARPPSSSAPGGGREGRNQPNRCSRAGPVPYAAASPRGVAVNAGGGPTLGPAPPCGADDKGCGEGGGRTLSGPPRRKPRHCRGCRRRL